MVLPWTVITLRHHKLEKKEKNGWRGQEISIEKVSDFLI